MKRYAKKKSSSSRRRVVGSAAVRDDMVADQTGIGADSVTVVSVSAGISWKDSMNGVSPAGELPTQIREALDKVLEKASKHPTHWTWEYLHWAESRKQGYTKPFSAFLGGADSVTHLYRKTLKTKPIIVQRHASKRILEMFAVSLALYIGESDETGAQFESRINRRG